MIPETRGKTARRSRTPAIVRRSSVDVSEMNARPDDGAAHWPLHSWGWRSTPSRSRELTTSTELISTSHVRRFPEQCVIAGKRHLTRSDPRVSCADLWEREAFLQPRLPHQRADTDPRDNGLQRFARRPDSDPRALWRPSAP